MKNLFLSAAIVLGGLTSFASTSPISNTIVKTISIQDEYTEIKLEEVEANDVKPPKTIAADKNRFFIIVIF